MPGILTMQFIVSYAMVLLFSVVVSGSAARNHPVETVINLLQELKKQVKDEGKTEEDSYNKFMQWCVKSTTDLEKAITSSEDSIDSLYDQIKANEAKIEVLTKDIEYLSQEVIDKEAAGATAKSARDAANSLYTKNDKDYESTITAIGEAISELEKTKGEVTFLEVSRKLVKLPLVLEQLSDEQREAIVKIAEQKFVPTANQTKGSKEDEEMRAAIKGVESYVGAGGADYIFKSGSVLELLNNLKTHFTTEREEATKAETAALNEFSLADAARKQAIAAAGALNATKVGLKTNAEGALIQNKADLSDEKAEVKADTANLETTQSSCAQKTSEWKERSKLRDHEVKAMEEAVWILEKVTGVQTTKPDATELPTSPVLLQFHMASAQADDPRSRAIELLRKEAQRTHSKIFEQFATKVASKLQRSGEGPFAEVINMIQKMIFRLKAEQTSEDEHKMWCDLETNKTLVSKDTKAAKVLALQGKVKTAKATIQVLTNDIKTKNGEIAEMKTWVKEATEIRQANKKNNEAAIEDAVAAQDALAKAIAVITKYYEDTGMVRISLAQAPEPVELPEEPSTWSASYTGVTDPSKQPDGIITVLKTVMSDFSQLEADVKAQDATEQVKFNEGIRTNTVTQAEYMTLVETKTEEKSRLVQKVDEWEDQEKHVQGELDATVQYYKDLGGACRDADSTYEDRKSARSDEITALKDAQTILASAFEDKKSGSFLQRRPSRRM